MNALPRCFLCALAAQTVLLGVCAVRPELAERLNLNVWKLPQMEGQAEQAQRDMNRADAQISEVQVRSGRRADIADEVTEGRMGLLEAAARFHDLNAGAPACTPDLRERYAGDSEEERCCRQVIAWVEARLKHKSTAEAERVGERLEEELREHLHPEATDRLVH